MNMVHLSNCEVKKLEKEDSLFGYKRRKVSASRDFPNGSGRNAAQSLNKYEECGTNVGAVEEKVPEFYKVRAVSAVRDFPAACGRDATPVNQNSNKDEECGRNVVEEVPEFYKVRAVSAVRDFPAACGRNAARVDQNSNKDEECGSNVVEEVAELYKVRDVSATRDFPVGCGRNAPRINGKSEKQGVLVGDVEKLKIKTDDACVEVMNLVESPEQVRIGNSHDDVPIENLGIELDGAIAEPTFGSSLLPKPLVKKTTSVVAVLVEIETLEPMKTLKPQLEENKSPDMTKRFQRVTTEVSEDLNPTEPCDPKNFDRSYSKNLLKSASTPKEKGHPSSLVQLPVDSVLAENGVELQVPEQLQTVNHVQDVEDRMHKKYPRRRVSACRDFPPCIINSRSIIEDNSFRDRGVYNGEANGENKGKQSGSSPYFPLNPLCSIVEVDSFGELNVGNEEASRGSNGEGRDDVMRNAKKNEDEDTLGSRLHVLVREASDSKMKQEDVESKGKKHQLVLHDEPKSSSGRKKVKVKASEGKFIEKEMASVRDVTYDDEGQLVLMNNHDYLREDTEDHSPIFQSQLEGNVELEPSNKRVIVKALFAAPNCPWNQEKQTFQSPNGPEHATTRRKRKKQELVVQGKSKVISRRRNSEVTIKCTNSKESSAENGSYGSSRQLALDGEDEYYNRHDNEGYSPFQTSQNMESSLVRFHPIVDKDDENEVGLTLLPLAQSSCSIDLTLIPFGIQPSINKDIENKAGVTRKTVRETLRLFQGIVRKLMHDEESKSKDVQANGSRRSKSNGVKTKDSGRFDLLAGKILKESQGWVNTGKPILGNVPGVEIGDEFHYRVELAVIGLHRPFQGGIDYLKEKMVATSVVASGGYADDMDSSNMLVYSGQGGIPNGENKKAEDQKLERGNLALKNSIDEGTPVRVIRGFKETKPKDSPGSRVKVATTYIYDGLYLVESYWEETGCYGTKVFKFQLRRISGQPELAIKEVKKLKKSRVREGLCVDDISQGKEKKTIGAINLVDDQNPPPFEYITNIIYPSWYNPTPPKGCDCVDGCSDSEKCLCARKNGGEIPFNYDGAIVEAKPLVYECGPLCRCPPSCHNRVSQNGIKFRLEIFKTQSRGWGVRSLTSIPSGSFVCEYTGELLQDEEAEKRTNDEYLFDIGHNYNDEALWEGLSNPIPVDSLASSCCEDAEDVGFTIDAALYGSVGRFVNHSCSPNLYAQNVLYDHDDKRMPHIMLFAAENIPPLQELTYHYNYELDQVRDSDGNIKKKSCYCGALDCTGRMY